MFSDKINLLKCTLRKAMLKKRREISVKNNLCCSDIILSQIVHHPTYEQSSCIMCYSAFADEVQTEKILCHALAKGKRVCVPFILDKNSKMEAAHIRNMEDLVIGTYGILSVAADKMERIEPMKINFIVVPGVAFDRQGHRLGMGGGFYDRFLIQAKNGFRLGIAFDRQLLKQVPFNETDCRMHAVLTEKELIDCK